MPHFSYQMPLGMISFGTQKGITVPEKKRHEKWREKWEEKIPVVTGKKNG